MVKDESKKNRKPRDSGDCRSGLGREFFPRGAAIWIPVTLFVLLVLFQMVPLPAGVLKVVSPATYELYEEMLPEVGERQRSEDGGRLATDPHRLTQTFVRRTSPDKNGHRFAKRQKTEERGKDEHRTSNPPKLSGGNVPTSNEKMKQRAEGQGTEVGKGQRSDVKEKDEHRTSNIERPTSNEKMKQRTEDRGERTEDGGQSGNGQRTEGVIVKCCV